MAVTFTRIIMKSDGATMPMGTAQAAKQQHFEIT